MRRRVGVSACWWTARSCTTSRGGPRSGSWTGSSRSWATPSSRRPGRDGARLERSPALPASMRYHLASTGEWPNGKAPDSGSGDSRFESLLASQPPHGRRWPPNVRAILVGRRSDEPDAHSRREHVPAGPAEHPRPAAARRGRHHHDPRPGPGRAALPGERPADPRGDPDLRRHRGRADLPPDPGVRLAGQRDAHRQRRRPDPARRRDAARRPVEHATAGTSSPASPRSRC